MNHSTFCWRVTIDFPMETCRLSRKALEADAPPPTPSPFLFCVHFLRGGQFATSSVVESHALVFWISQNSSDACILPLSPIKVRNFKPVQFVNDALNTSVFGDEHPIDFSYPVDFGCRSRNQDYSLVGHAFPFPTWNFSFGSSIRRDEHSSVAVARLSTRPKPIPSY